MADTDRTSNNGSLPPANGELRRAPGADAPRLSPRTLLLALVWLAAAVVGMLVLLQLLVVQRIPPLDETRLAAAEEQWEQHGPLDYDMELEIGGVRPGTVHVRVRDGEATAMTRDDRTPAPHVWHYWTVPGRFEELERELELAEDPVHEMHAHAQTRLELRCDFDPQYGFPRVYHRVVYGGGPEVYWRVTRFEAL